MHGDCMNLEGGFHCICRNGYTLNALGDRCVDINECQRVPNVCKNGTCENMNGSYKCYCSEGFKLSDRNDCVGSYTLDSIDLKVLELLSLILLHVLRFILLTHRLADVPKKFQEIVKY